jgi:ParB family chromosome partitioning protein
MWANHNRDYKALTEERCRDLIESLLSSGKQEMPAICRPVSNDPNYDYEVICGARRHWAITWLRGNNYPQFRFLIEVRRMTDEEAFRVSDLENRNRQDISDLERAWDYLKAVDLYYHGSQQEMADRLKVSKSWLSKLLNLTKLPPEVLQAFPSSLSVSAWHGEQLGPLLNREPAVVDRIFSEARVVAAEQAKARGEGRGPIEPKDVVRRLLSAAQSKATSTKEVGEPGQKSTSRSHEGNTVFEAEGLRGGGFKIKAAPGSNLDRASLIGFISAFIIENPTEAKFVIDLTGA